MTTDSGAWVGIAFCALLVGIIIGIFVGVAIWRSGP